MQIRGGKPLCRVIRWSIPFLSAALCLCFRFTHFRWQILTALLCFVLSWLLFCTKRRMIRRDGVALTVSVLLFLFLGADLLLVYGIHHTQYESHNVDRNVFRDQKILVMVPHQDDEINLLGGLYEIFEEGSEVYVMFSTNGDKVVSGETRIKEAVGALNSMGIDREHMIFLGYGDSVFNQGDVYFYNLPGDEEAASSVASETYAADGFEPYRHSTYTRDHMKDDIRELLLELQPDVIFCIDFDYHHDHRALSLLFEEAMGEILHRGQNDYTPAVFKGFGYSTAYLGEPDFYAKNIKSTVPYSELYPFPGDYYLDDQDVKVYYMGENNIYRWDDRIRFPVSENNLSRTLHSSDLFNAMRFHRSQEDLYSALSYLRGIINGDKVFWPRSTFGILYQATVSVSSGDGSMLTDFKLTDSSNLYDKERKPFENLWTPDGADDRKMATFTFTEETEIRTIMLYDNPSLTDNITRLRILFSDGSALECGPLIKNGSGTMISFEEKMITSFSVQILESEGDHPGLSEMEAYGQTDPFEFVPEMIKLQDHNGDFAYDYWMEDGSEVFSVYHSRESMAKESAHTWSLRILSGNCEIRENEDQTFTVSLGKGASAKLALYMDDIASPVDQITIRNPFMIEKWWGSLLIEAEKNLELYTPSEQYTYFKETILDYLQKYFQK